jgi:hypothetical protein
MMRKNRYGELDRLSTNVRMAWFNSEGETDVTVVRDMMLAGLKCEGEGFIIAIRIAHHLRLWIDQENVRRFRGYSCDLRDKVPIAIQHPPMNSWQTALKFLVKGNYIREAGNREYIVLGRNDDLV